MQYGLEGLKEVLRISIAKHQALADEWAKVTRHYKKDGTDFANMDKNFSCGVQKCTSSEKPWRKSLHVFVCATPGGYASDKIMIYRTVNNYDREDYADRDIIDDGYYSYFLYTADELEEKIRQHIAHHRRQAEDAERDLEVLDKVYDEFHGEVMGAMKKMRDQVSCSSKLIELVKKDMH